MSAIQYQLPITRPLQARVRSVRRPFHPSGGQGPYKLPRSLQDRLASALASFRNRDAAFALATFLARFWSMPGRVTGTFPIDRRALAEHEHLGLSEAQVRGAIKALEAVGYLERAIPAPGSRYKPTEAGLRRKPILFAFGATYTTDFVEANKRAQRARSRRSAERRPVTPLGDTRASTRLPAVSSPISPKNKASAYPVVFMGEIGPKVRKPVVELDETLGSALERLRKAIGANDKNPAN